MGSTWELGHVTCQGSCASSPRAPPSPDSSHMMGELVSSLSRHLAAYRATFYRADKTEICISTDIPNFSRKPHFKNLKIIVRTGTERILSVDCTSGLKLNLHLKFLSLKVVDKYDLN